MIQKCFNHARMKYARYKNTDMSFSASSYEGGTSQTKSKQQLLRMLPFSLEGVDVRSLGGLLLEASSWRPSLGRLLLKASS